MAHAVYIGSVKKVDANFQRALNGRDGLFIVARTVKLRHAHAAQTDGRYHRRRSAQAAIFHRGTSLSAHFASVQMSDVLRVTAMLLLLHAETFCVFVCLLATAAEAAFGMILVAVLGLS